ncbi:hypothetical protein J2W25_002128 [Variovorax boronicumulans]|uniref:HNH endonuclease n=1 Tax=Variovorax boronicumulans TaxID=436515 RepID=A0AAW8DUI1_9BURK|nr:hypothetical protein [Variovorax boronicumulans]MDP9877823.1 hypothetical protein [Variovorax boronicumulans]MDP9923107.1 hypothetical protein [Variovorax boronicumulans]
MRVDDFSPDLIRRLRERVAHRCSNPDCRVVTTAAGAGEMGVNSIGRAAHISAASAGGPRYAPSISSKQRRSIENAIWLCGNCHIKVDNEEQAYPTSLLQSWKLHAEDSARRELGQRLITDTDAQNTLIAALGGVPTQFPRTAVANVIAASELELRRLDPRFLVQSTYVNKTLVHEIRAVEPVPISFRMTHSSEVNDVFSNMKSMLDHGTALTIPARSISTSGSPLVAHILEITAANEGSLTFSPELRTGTLKLVLVHPTTNQVRSFDDMPGTIKAGRKSITFDGSNCGGALRISFQKDFADDSPPKNCEFFADLQRWNGNDIRYLTYHEKLDQLFKDLAEGWTLEVALEIEGRELLRGNLHDTKPYRSYISRLNVFLAYSIRARSIARHLNKRVEFRDDITFSKGEHKALIDALHILEGKKVYTRSEMNENVTCRMELTDDSATTLLQRRDTPTEVMIRASEQTSIRVFEQDIFLPPLEVVLQAVFPKLLSRTPVKAGRKVRVEFEPSEEFQCIYRYRALAPSGSALATPTPPIQLADCERH